MPKEDWKENTVEKIFTRNNLWPWKDGEIKSILDVACGLSLKSKYIKADIRVGVDIYKEYFNHIETDVEYIPVVYDVRKMQDIFLPKTFDIVLALDIVEHLEKEESLELLKQCEKFARKAVIIETPNGYIPQNIDILGHGGHEFQTHRCGWTVEELEKLGFKTIVRPYKMSNAKRHTDLEVNAEVELIDAIKFIE
jgi:2-polyprenyl-3-methyl-5-hydroxy-6-metoxy-1,4-benzoquinol methylase